MEWIIVKWLISIIVFIAIMGSTHKNGLFGAIGEFWK